MPSHSVVEEGRKFQGSRNLLVGAVLVQLALPLATTRPEGEGDGLGLQNRRDILARHVGCV